MSDEQQENLARVRAAIGGAVLVFWRERLAADPVFAATELRAYVEAQHPGLAPDSPSRILRVLRQQGVVNYVVVNRAASRYRALAVGEVR